MVFVPKTKNPFMRNNVQILDNTLGHIRGRVIDGDGQSIPGCKVWLRETEQHAYSDKNGDFVLINILPARYTVIVEHVYFSPRISPDIPIEVGDNPGLRFVMHPEALPEESWGCKNKIKLGFQM
jgi:hypothetical protein